MEQAKAALEELEVVRCFNCRNLMGLVRARIVGEGLLVCERCAAQEQTLVGPGGEVGIVGL